MNSSATSMTVNSHECLSYLPGSGILPSGLSGSKMPFCTNSSRLARTEILRSSAVRCKELIIKTN